MVTLMSNPSHPKEDPMRNVCPAINRIGVVGAGVMGSGIAQWCAARGYAVVLRDAQPAALTRADEVIRGLFAEAVRRGKLDETAASAGLARLGLTADWKGFAECDLVIEAIVEDVAAKRALFAELAGIVRPEALLASNTSALPIEAIAGQVPYPERTLGLHFFNPVSRMRLVELVCSRDTAPAVVAAVQQWVGTLGRTAVVCRSSPGFVVTRVLFFYLNAACGLAEAGVPVATIDRAMQGWGWPMGPMRLIDEVGVDVTDFIFGEMAHYFPRRFVRTTRCEDLLKSGFRGRKNGASAGFYTYEGNTVKPNPAVETLLARGALKTNGDMTDVEIAARLMQVMREEARHCLEEGVVADATDVDRAMTLGAGYPTSRGSLVLSE
jgi:3-hydroxyacyl-CoA dehydrogenase/enoyl-CoA hydratase/3-hydroxybutyryl-CoA epimerase